LQELAERRQRQLEELRRRQAGASPSTPPTARPAAAPPTPPVAHAGHSSAGRTETITTQSAQGTPTAFPELTRPPAPVERPSEAMPTRGKMTRQTSKPPRQRAAKPVDQRPRYAADFQAQMEQAADKAIRDAKATAAAAADAKLDLASGRSRRTSPLGPVFASVNAENVSAADWRRAIILREILDRPVSERADPYRDQTLSIL
jgi:hypothetical protein